MNEIAFGTDGWRGIIAEDFTFGNVRRLAQAVAQYLKQAGLSRQGILIGYDTRFASEDFALAAMEVMASNGIEGYLCSHATPTPTVSFGVTRLQSGGAIVITASHNPAQWNGFKIKTETGASAPPSVVKEIEDIVNHISGQVEIDASTMPGDKWRSVDLAPAYLQHLGCLVDIKAIKEAGLNIVVDSMFGSGAGYVANMLTGSKTQVQEIDNLRNPIFPGIKQPEPNASNLRGLSLAVREARADVGLATDGDADRLGVMDEKGNFITPGQVLSLLALYLLEVRDERGPIVKTVATSSMLYRLGEIYQVPVYETPVGFRHIAPLMLAHNALIGGEESGGYGFRSHIPERDGILAGLFFLDLMVKRGKTPSQLVGYLQEKVGPHHFERLDIPFPASRRREIGLRLAQASPSHINHIPVKEKDTKDGFRFWLDDGCWVLMRFSGTEPLLRIYAEADTPEKARLLVQSGQSLALG